MKFTTQFKTWVLHCGIEQPRVAWVGWSLVELDHDLLDDADFPRGRLNGVRPGHLPWSNPNWSNFKMVKFQTG